MVAEKKRGYVRKTAEEQIKYFQEQIRLIKQREIQRTQKIVDKKHLMIGRSLVKALRDDFIDMSTFTVIVSRYADKPSDIEALRENFNLDADSLVVKPPKRGRPHHKIKATKRVVDEIGMGSLDPATETTALSESGDIFAAPLIPKEKAAAATEAEKEPELEAPKTIQRKKPKVKITLVSKKEERAEELRKKEAKRLADIAADDEIFGDEMEDDDSDNVFNVAAAEPAKMTKAQIEADTKQPSNIIDPRLYLSDIENFARRGRLLDRLRLCEIYSLGDLITKSERDFSRMPGVQMGTVRTCKAILSEMGLGFKS